MVWGREKPTKQAWWLLLGSDVAWGSSIKRHHYTLSTFPDVFQKLKCSSLGAQVHVVPYPTIYCRLRSAFRAFGLCQGD